MKTLIIIQLIAINSLFAIPSISAAKHIPTASGQDVIINSEGDLFLDLSKQTPINYQSPIDGKSYEAELPGRNTSNGRIYEIRNGFICEGGGAHGGGSPGCQEISSEAPKISIANTFVDGDLDYITLAVKPRDRSRTIRLDVPACGLSVVGGSGTGSLPTLKEILDTFKSRSSLLPTLALNNPLSAHEAELAGFESLPEEMYIRKQENGLRVSTERLTNHGNTYETYYEFVRTSRGIEIFLSPLDPSYKKTIVGILPSDIRLADIEVGSAFSSNPFNGERIESLNNYIRVKKGSSEFLLNISYSFPNKPNTNGILANYKFGALGFGSVQFPTEADVENTVRHQCFMQALIR